MDKHTHTTLSRETEARRQIITLTGVRGVACAWVLLFHANLLLFDLKAAKQSAFLVRGYLGVDLFFLLSGFVLAMTAGARLARADRGAAKRFYIGRAFRILPLHWTVLIAFALVGLVSRGEWLIAAPHDFTSWAASFLLIQNWIGLGQTWNTPAWSLSAEWLAYLAFPVLAIGVARVGNARLAILLAAAALAGLAAVAMFWRGTPDYGEPGKFGLVRCAVEFTTGMLIFRAAELAPDFRRCGDWCLAVAAFVVAASIPFEHFDLFIPVGFALTVYACWSEGPVTKALFGNRLVAWLGEISFSLYIVHWFMIEVAFAVLFDRNEPRTPAMGSFAVVCAIGLSVPVAVLLNHLVEKPSHERGRALLASARFARRFG